jgi:hypothetical protein
MTKVQKSSQTITPLAGIYLVNDEFQSSGVQQLIDNEIGMRVSTIGYSYGKIFKTWFNIFFCGGECAEDIQEHLRATLSQIPDNQVPSADTLLRVLSELETENTVVTSSSGQKYNFNINEKLNNLNIKILLKTTQKGRIL